MEPRELTALLDQPADLLARVEAALGPRFGIVVGEVYYRCLRQFAAPEEGRELPGPAVARVRAALDGLGRFGLEQLEARIHEESANEALAARFGDQLRGVGLRLGAGRPRRPPPLRVELEREKQQAAVRALRRPPAGGFAAAAGEEKAELLARYSLEAITEPGRDDAELGRALQPHFPSARETGRDDAAEVREWLEARAGDERARSSEHAPELARSETGGAAQEAPANPEGLDPRALYLQLLEKHLRADPTRGADDALRAVRAFEALRGDLKSAVAERIRAAGVTRPLVRALGRDFGQALRSEDARRREQRGEPPRKKDEEEES
jgi:hypothetical protein